MKKLLTGNEAIAGGVIESGVEVVCGYPGTPSTEVILTLLPQEKQLGIHIEWSVNEKVKFFEKNEGFLKFLSNLLNRCEE